MEIIGELSFNSQSKFHSSLKIVRLAGRGISPSLLKQGMFCMGFSGDALLNIVMNNHSIQWQPRSIVFFWAPRKFSSRQ